MVTVMHTDEKGNMLQAFFVINVEHTKDIFITRLPNKTTYKIGEAIDYTDIALQTQALSGNTAYLRYGDARLTFDPPEGTIVSSDMDVNLPVTVTYTEGAHSRSTAFTLTVDKLLSMDVSLPPIKTQYQVGEEIDYSGISFIVRSTLETKNIGKNEVIFDVPEGTIASLSTSKTVTATYTNSDGFSISTTFNISIGMLNQLRIIQQPTKTTYKIGDALDYTGLRLVAETSNGIQTTLSGSDEGLILQPQEGTTVTADMGISINILVTYINEFNATAETNFTVSIEV